MSEQNKPNIRRVDEDFKLARRHKLAVSAGRNVRIMGLLRSTELTIAEIASRMGVSASVVSLLNRERGIRKYQEGRRGSWTVGGVRVVI